MSIVCPRSSAASIASFVAAMSVSLYRLNAGSIPGELSAKRKEAPRPAPEASATIFSDDSHRRSSVVGGCAHHTAVESETQVEFDRIAAGDRCVDLTESCDVLVAGRLVREQDVDNLPGDIEITTRGGDADQMVVSDDRCRICSTSFASTSARGPSPSRWSRGPRAYSRRPHLLQSLPLAARGVEVLGSQPRLEGGTSGGPLRVSDRVPGGISISTLDHPVLPKDALENKTKPLGGATGRLVGGIAFPLEPPVAQALKCVPGHDEDRLGRLPRPLELG